MEIESDNLFVLQSSKTYPDAASEAKLDIFNLTAVPSLEPIGSTNLKGQGQDMQVSNRYVYIPGYWDNFTIIDTTDLSSPVTIGLGDYGFFLHAVGVSGNYAITYSTSWPSKQHQYNLIQLW